MLCDKKYKGFTLKCDKVSTELHTSSFFNLLISSLVLPVMNTLLNGFKIDNMYWYCE